MPDFTYVPDSIDETATFAVDKVQFGDGYAQRIPNGINNGLRTWNVTFNDRAQADTDAITSFFTSRYGSQSFTWQPPGFSSQVHVVCSKYSKPYQNRFQNGAMVYSISATFEETPS